MISSSEWQLTFHVGTFSTASWRWPLQSYDSYSPSPYSSPHVLCIKTAPQPSSLLQFPSQKNNLHFGTDSIMSFPMMLSNFPPGSQYSHPFSLILKSQSLPRSQLMPIDPKTHQWPTVHPTHKYLNFFWI